MMNHNNNELLPTATNTAILVEGWLSKRSSRVKGNKFWSTRYFLLRKSGLLSYYTRKSDVYHRGRMQLVRGCTVSLVFSADNESSNFDTSVIMSSPGPGETNLGATADTDLRESASSNVSGNERERHGLYVLRITWPALNASTPDIPELEVADVVQNDIHDDSGAEDNTSLMNSAKDCAVAKRDKKKKRLIQGSKYAAATGAAVTIGILTAGIGLAAGLTFVAVSAAAGGGGVVATKTLSRSKRVTGARDLNERTLVLSSTEYDLIHQWKEALDMVLEKLNSGKLENELLAASSTETAPFSTVYDTIISSLNGRYGSDIFMQSATQQELAHLTQMSQWKPIDGGWAAILGFSGQGLRIYSEEVTSEGDRRARRRVPRLPFDRRELSVKDRPCPAVKSRVILNAKPMDAFCHLMAHGCVSTFDGNKSRSVPDHSISSFRIIETMDQHMDIIHLVFRPLYLFPSWTAPRDFCLSRYWKYEDDGTYIICFDSTAHRDCPPLASHVRGDLHGVYMISPRKQCVSGNSSPEECLMTQIIQVDPKGWVPTTNISFLSGQGYADAFSIAALLQMLDIRDNLNYNRFVTTKKGSMYRQTQLKTLLSKSLHPGDRSEVKLESNDVEEDDEADENDLLKETKPSPPTKNTTASPSSELAVSIQSMPSPFRLDMWAEPDSKTFRVRGKTYKSDKKKRSAGESMFRLLAVDLVETSQNIMSGMCTHPRERVACALAREAEGNSDMPPFVFVLNIAIPGPPFLHLVIYFAVDNIDCINGKDGTPFSRLANKFFFGDDDEFRDNTFKLIPRIVEGNFIVRKAVGNTPAIMGTKLKQYYVRSNRYLEIILDIGSSSVAAGVIRLASGYAKTLIVDMGFVLQGDNESVLPEKIMGCCRLKNICFKNLRQVGLPDDY